jgi:hypothetical protein
MMEVDLEVKMSLRLWSDTRDLGDVVRELGRPSRHHHKKGEVVQVGRHGRPRVPIRHYVSYPDAEAHDFAGVETWLTSELDLLERSSTTAALTRSGVVEAVLWIALFGNAAVELPSIGDQFVGRARALGVKIFVENYSPDLDAEGKPPGGSGDDTGSESPRKTWYPKE